MKNKYLATVVLVLRDISWIFKNRVAGKMYMRIFKIIIVYLVFFISYQIYQITAAKKIGLAEKIFKPVIGILHVKERMFTETAKVDLSRIKVNILPIHSTLYTPSIEAPGTIEYLKKIDIASKVAGRIQQIHVSEGDFVKKGQVIVKIETLPLALQLSAQKSEMDSALSRLKLAKERYHEAKLAVEIKWMEYEKKRIQLQELAADLRRIKTSFKGKEILYNQGGISKEEYEKAKTELISREAEYLITRKNAEIAKIGFRDEDLAAKGMEIPTNNKLKFLKFVDINTRIQKAELDVAQSAVSSSQASMESTKLLIKESTIRSPITGVVALMNKSAGEEANAGATTNISQAIMVIYEMEHVFAAMNIKEEDFRDIKNGIQMSFKVDLYPNRDFRGNIQFISPSLDPQTHTITVKAKIPNPNKQLLPGMFIRGKIEKSSPEKVIFVPEKFILSDEKENWGWVFVVRNNIIYKTRVELGQQVGDNLVIRNGLKQGDEIATEKLKYLQDGMKINRGKLVFLDMEYKKEKPGLQ